MFKRLFGKYARTISDKRERKRLYRLYCAKVFSAIVFFVMCIVTVAVSLTFYVRLNEGSEAALIVCGVTLTLWFVSAITALTLPLVFRIAYRAISRRPADPWGKPKTYSAKDLSKALKAVRDIYGLEDIQVQATGSSFRLTFFFMQRKITADKREDRTGDIYLEIEVTEKPHIPSVEVSPTNFGSLYAYYDDKRCVAHYDNHNLRTYLKYLKRYIQENKIFYMECDIQNERRYFYIDGVQKELPYAMNLETETALRFGDKAERIERNYPIE